MREGLTVQERAAIELSWKAAKAKARQLQRQTDEAAAIKKEEDATYADGSSTAADDGCMPLSSLPGMPTYAQPPMHYPLDAAEQAAFSARWIPFWQRYRQSCAVHDDQVSSESDDASPPLYPRFPPNWSGLSPEQRSEYLEACDRAQEYRIKRRVVVAARKMETEYLRRANAPKRDRPNRRPAAAAASMRLQAQAAEEVGQQHSACTICAHLAFA